MKGLLSRERPWGFNEAAIVLSITLLTFVLLFALKASQQSPDSLMYAFSAKTGRELFHPHHMIFNPAIHLLFRIVSAICDSCDAVLAGQIHNAMWAVLAVLSTYFVVKQLLLCNPAGIAAAVFLLISNGFWTYATQVEVYVPATGCLALLVMIMVARRSVGLGTTEKVMISLLLVASILYHQTNVLFCIPLGYYLVAGKEEKDRGALVAILWLAGIIVMSAYVLAFLATNEDRTLGHFVRFCLSYALLPQPSWGTLANVSVGGVGRLFQSQLWNIVAFPSNLRYVAAFMSAAMFAVLCGWHIVQVLRHAEYARFRGFLLVWLMTYFAFFLWWFPGEHEFYVTTLFPILLLVCLSLRDMVNKLPRSNVSKRITVLAITIVACFIFVSSLRAILPLHQSRGTAYDRAYELHQLAPQECMIYTDFEVLHNIRYYFNRERISELQIPLLFLYQNRPLPEEYDLEQERCAVVPLLYVKPEYTFMDFSGYQNPSEWLKYLEWLFGFEYDPHQSLVSHRQFQIVSARQGESYILVYLSKTAVNGLDAFTQTLDSRVSDHLGERVDSFHSWFSTTYPGD